MADYMKLCRLSASDFYPSMLKQVGLTVPFTDGCIQKIVDELDKKLLKSSDKDCERKSNFGQEIGNSRES